MEHPIPDKKDSITSASTDEVETSEELPEILHDQENQPETMNTSPSTKLEEVSIDENKPEEIAEPDLSKLLIKEECKSRNKKKRKKSGKKDPSGNNKTGDEANNSNKKIDEPDTPKVNTSNDSKRKKNKKKPNKEAENTNNSKKEEKPEETNSNKQMEQSESSNINLENLPEADKMPEEPGVSTMSSNDETKPEDGKKVDEFGILEFRINVENKGRNKKMTKKFNKKLGNASELKLCITSEEIPEETNSGKQVDNTPGASNINPENPPVTIKMTEEAGVFKFRISDNTRSGDEASTSSFRQKLDISNIFELYVSDKNKRKKRSTKKPEIPNELKLHINNEEKPEETDSNEQINKSGLSKNTLEDLPDTIKTTDFGPGDGANDLIAGPDTSERNKNTNKTKKKKSSKKVENSKDPKVSSKNEEKQGETYSNNLKDKPEITKMAEEPGVAKVRTSNENNPGNEEIDESVISKPIIKVENKKTNKKKKSNKKVENSNDLKVSDKQIDKPGISKDCIKVKTKPKDGTNNVNSCKKINEPDISKKKKKTKSKKKNGNPINSKNEEKPVEVDSSVQMDEPGNSNTNLENLVETTKTLEGPSVSNDNNKLEERANNSDSLERSDISEIYIKVEKKKRKIKKKVENPVVSKPKETKSCKQVRKSGVHYASRKNVPATGKRIKGSGVTKIYDDDESEPEDRTNNLVTYKKIGKVDISEFLVIDQMQRRIKKNKKKSRGKFVNPNDDNEKKPVETYSSKLQNKPEVVDTNLQNLAKTTEGTEQSVARNEHKPEGGANNSNSFDKIDEPATSEHQISDEYKRKKKRNKKSNKKSGSDSTLCSNKEEKPVETKSLKQMEKSEAMEKLPVTIKLIVEPDVSKIGDNNNKSESGTNEPDTSKLKTKSKNKKKKNKSSKKVENLNDSSFPSGNENESGDGTKQSKRKEGSIDGAKERKVAEKTKELQVSKNKNKEDLPENNDNPDQLLITNIFMLRTESMVKKIKDVIEDSRRNMYVCREILSNTDFENIGHEYEPTTSNSRNVQNLEDELTIHEVTEENGTEQEVIPQIDKEDTEKPFEINASIKYTTDDILHDFKRFEEDCYKALATKKGDETKKAVANKLEETSQFPDEENIAVLVENRPEEPPVHLSPLKEQMKKKGHVAKKSAKTKTPILQKEEVQKQSRSQASATKSDNELATYRNPLSLMFNIENITFTFLPICESENNDQVQEVPKYTTENIFHDLTEFEEDWYKVITAEKEKEAKEAAAIKESGTSDEENKAVLVQNEEKPVQLSPLKEQVKREDHAEKEPAKLETVMLQKEEEHDFPDEEVMQSVKEDTRGIEKSPQIETQPPDNEIITSGNSLNSVFNMENIKFTFLPGHEPDDNDQDLTQEIHLNIFKEDSYEAIVDGKIKQTDEGEVTSQFTDEGEGTSQFTDEGEGTSQFNDEEKDDAILVQICPEEKSVQLSPSKEQVEQGGQVEEPPKAENPTSEDEKEI